VTVSIHVLHALQRKREHSFKDFWAGVEGKRSIAASVEIVTAKLARIDKEAIN
jgi:hypothetical protein